MRTALVVGVAVASIASWVSPVSASTLFNQPFQNNTVNGSAGTVSAPAATGLKTNVVCLSAAGNATANPLASCAAPNDAQGSGALRLTSAGGGQEGGIFANGSVPTSQGLDVTFNSYQYGIASSGADGLAFALAAVDPANPLTPTILGPTGGAFGYSAFTSTAGLTHAYLGIGVDPFGNFSNKLYEGTGCTDPANMSVRMPGEVAVRGPGQGTVGYCALNSSAATATSTPLTLRATTATRAPAVVPIEVAYNPSAVAVTTPSGLVVPARSYEVKYTPVGGAAKTLAGALPVVPAGLYPASWVNASGFPKQLTFGWVGSTGSVIDTHEIANALVTTLNPVPVLAVSQTSYAAATLPAGSPVTYTLAASASGASETLPVTVTETLPAGVLPVGASGTGWVCGVPSGQQISCTNGTNPFISGSITVNGVVNTAGATAGVTAAVIAASSSATASSSDGSTGTSSNAPAGTIPTTPSPLATLLPTGPAGGDNDVKVTGTNLGGATAIEIGTAAEFAAGTPTTEVLCAASAPGCFTVTSAVSLDIPDMPAHAAGLVTVNVVSLGIAGTTAYTYAAGPALLFAAPPSGEANVAYSDQLTAVGGTPPYHWSLSSGTLPAGLTLGASTGLLSGTPASAAVGTDAFTIQVTDSLSQTDTKTVSLAIIAAPSLGFAALPAGWTRTVYGDTLTESGGTAPFTWAIASGSLPAGISLSPDGVLSGTPTAVGTASFTVSVTDANGQSATQAASLSVADGVRATGTAPPQADVNVAYSYTAGATGGTAPYTWSINAGSLPAGLTLSAAGVLSGTPTLAGSYPFSVNVIDQNGGIDTLQVTFVVAPAVAVTSAAALPSADIHAAYSTALSASGGTGAYTWSLTSGTLPAGLLLAAATGIVSGTPSATGVSSFTVTAVDSYGQSSSKPTTLTVDADPLLGFGTPPAGEVGVAYADQLTESAGTAPLAWTVSVGSLPAGLTLSASTGLISGTPTTAATSNFTVTVTDADSQSATQATSISIVGDPALAFAAPPGGEVGVAYSDQLAASGGLGTYTWSTTGTLPAGVTLGGSTGLLAGTPTSAGTFSFTVKVTDSAGQFATQAASVTVAADPLLGFGTPPAGEVGVAYSDQLTKSGGTGPFVWTVSVGSLPAGLSLGGSTGLISGTPSAAAASSFTIQVKDAGGQIVTQATSITVVGDPVLTFGPPPAGEVNVGYSDQLAASGGTGTFAWTTSGTLPGGVALSSSTGLLSGIPTAAGTFSFTVTATDSDGEFSTQATSVTIVADPLLGFGTPPAGEVGVAYSDQLTKSGGTGPFVWTVSVGSLPTGLSLSASTGLISGTPSAVATSSFTIQVKDADGQVATQATSISVVGDPILAFPAPPAGEVGAAYSDQLTASGGMGSYTWSTTGSLPGGVTLNTATGLLSGTPTTAGTFNFTVKVTDSANQSTTEAASVTVAAAPLLGFASPPVGEVGAAYSDQLTESGGTAPFVWSVSAGSLPAGLSLSASTGLISGTPSAVVSASFTIQLKDADNQVVTQSASISVVGDPVLAFPAPPAGEVGVAYSDQLAASGGTGTYTWSVAAGLPPGVTLGASTGLLSGTPTSAGPFSFTVTVTDGAGQVATEATSLNITATISISPAVPPEGVITNGVGASYGPLALTANGLSSSCGAIACSWSVTPALPPGLTLSNPNPNSASAAISGTPTAVKTAIVAVTVSQGGVAQATFPLTISDIENLTTGIGAFPTGMVADTRNARVYVAASRSNQVDSIDASANPIKATPTLTALGTSVLRFPDGLAYSSASNALFASDYGSTSAAHVSPPSTGTPHSDFVTGCGEQAGIAQDTGGTDVWVGCSGNGSSGKVAVMTPSGGSVGSFVLGAGASSPSGVAPTGTSGHVAVADAAAGRLYTVGAAGPIGSAAALPAGSAPANVAYANVGGTPFDYVADPGTGQFSIVSEATDSSPVVAANVTLPKATNPPQPYGIATDGSALVVSDANNASAYVYTLTASAPYATLRYTIALPSSAVPDGVADMTVAGTNLAFIGNEGGNSVTVIDPPLPGGESRVTAPKTPIHLGLIGRRIGHALPGSPRARARGGHAVYPALK
ncbi:MAG TPA: putative Ig domain-containing protein [Solirubrobacteraceae bacterium]